MSAARGAELDVAVVGAGIAGLSAAAELRRAGHTVRVFEAADRVGGRMRSLRRAGFTVDEGAEQISTQGYRATWQLLRRLGVRPPEVPRIGRGVGVWRGGRAHPGVGSPRAQLTGAGLSPRARLDLTRFLVWTARQGAALDADRPERGPLGARTLAEFAGQYHPELHDYLFQPLTGAFFGWDPAESCAGPAVSLLREVGPVSAWRTYRNGMDMVARRLAAGLDVVCDSQVREVTVDGDVARLTVGERTLTARAVVLAVPAPVAARLRPDAPEVERSFLAACDFTPMLKVSCPLERPLAPPGGDSLYVLLTPRVEEDTLAGIVLDHAKHPGRVPPGRGLVSLIASPHQLPELLTAPRAEVIDLLTRAAERYLPGLNATRTNAWVHAFEHGLPAATPAALARRGAFHDRPLGPVEYAGDWVLLRPASEGAVRSAALAAARVLARLASTTAGPSALATPRHP
ncbi:NAD(P)/FAD-dependent oxidoreductase [Streptomyces sp. DSM 44915]|uniref:NAD(P)/FAD-dependent oxidoreductase n=1 Tax=Streptomyces chisholmiae TaxID=3075540 RepID=A0ABU2JNH2_9ACTN|nr:NAD(P)/FAD-dependent oxidoreductase [Streptomyces sp. DSM 44915]MDT0266546.1 NAD(P)/FAD-dependent oxidoreductase [Streptomyces sp. DSM 44915]